jgi:hypothetical protein
LTNMMAAATTVATKTVWQPHKGRGDIFTTVIGAKWPPPWSPTPTYFFLIIFFFYLWKQSVFLFLINTTLPNQFFCGLLIQKKKKTFVEYIYNTFFKCRPHEINPQFLPFSKPKSQNISQNFTKPTGFPY